jgi:hypothetical protein
VAVRLPIKRNQIDNRCTQSTHPVLTQPATQTVEAIRRDSEKKRSEMKCKFRLNIKSPANTSDSRVIMQIRASHNQHSNTSRGGHHAEVRAKSEP